MFNTPHQQEQHDMQLVTIHPAGPEEWYCPICQRRFLIQWPPNYEKVILEAGDEAAIHSGGKGGLQMQPPKIGLQDSFEQEDVTLSDELRAALEEVLKDIDFDDWLDASE